MVCLASLGAVPEDKGVRLWTALERSVAPLVTLQRGVAEPSGTTTRRRLDDVGGNGGNGGRQGKETAETTETAGSTQVVEGEGEEEDGEEETAVAVNEDEPSVSEEGRTSLPDNVVVALLRGGSIPLSGGDKGLSAISSMMDLASRAGFETPSQSLTAILVSQVYKPPIALLQC